MDGGWITVDSVGRFSFKRPLVFMVEREGCGIVIWNDASNLMASGRDMDEVMADLLEDLEFVWAGYARAPDGDLRRSGVAFKRWLLENLVVSPSRWCRVGDAPHLRPGSGSRPYILHDVTSRGYPL